MQNNIWKGARMKIIRKKGFSSRGLRIILFMLIVFVSTPLTGGCMSVLDTKDSISNLSFNHDGRKVVFDRCRSGGCQIQVYDLETGELAAYQSPKGERWTMGKYAYDGKRITFSVIPINSKGILDLGDMQIAVMDADGKNYKKVTTGQGAKLYPTFSHSGKKILYARAAYIRKEGRTPAGQYDAWEVNLENGGQKQLTFFEYFYMGNLTYFPDDERFIYYGEMPNVFPGARYGYGTDFNKNMVELAKKGMGIHGLVVMKGQKLIPNPYRFPEQTFPQKPLLSKDGSMLIYEKSHSGKFYLYLEHGNHRYIGGGGSIGAAAISPNGELLGVISVNLAIDVFKVKDGQVLTSQYLQYAKKKIVNWKEVYKESEIMIPEKPSLILNQ
ncbi:MAG: translocation protein TolB [Bacteroidetes bacterium ADurb.BinA104]|nr:MAG: translocation protein TolB [Bacteroidetes bacterium ADurb.BinA104]